jgi:hypothetical protein
MVYQGRRQSVGLCKVRRRLSCLTLHASPHRLLFLLSRALSWLPVLLFSWLLLFSFSCRRLLVPSRGGVVPHRRPLVHHLRIQSPLRQLQRPPLLHLWEPPRHLPFCNLRSVVLLSFLSLLSFAPLGRGMRNRACSNVRNRTTSLHVSLAEGRVVCGSTAATSENRWSSESSLPDAAQRMAARSAVATGLTEVLQQALPLDIGEVAGKGRVHKESSVVYCAAASPTKHALKLAGFLQKWAVIRNIRHGRSHLDGSGRGPPK